MLNLESWRMVRMQNLVFGWPDALLNLVTVAGAEARWTVAGAEASSTEAGWTMAEAGCSVSEDEASCTVAEAEAD